MSENNSPTYRPHIRTPYHEHSHRLAPHLYLCSEYITYACARQSHPVGKYAHMLISSRLLLCTRHPTCSQTTLHPTFSTEEPLQPICTHHTARSFKSEVPPPHSALKNLPLPSPCPAVSPPTANAHTAQAPPVQPRAASPPALPN